MRGTASGSAAPAFESLGGAQRLAGRALRGALAGDRPSGAAGRSVAEVLAEEQPSDGAAAAVRWFRRTHQAGLADLPDHFERNRYSVPASLANRPVSLRVYADRLVVAAEGQVIAEHAPGHRPQSWPGRTVYDWRHYLSVLQRKPGALRNGAPFAELPEALQATAGGAAQAARW